MVEAPQSTVEGEAVETLEESARGEGGFGHTGKGEFYVKRQYRIDGRSVKKKTIVHILKKRTDRRFLYTITIHADEKIFISYISDMYYCFRFLFYRKNNDWRFSYR